MTHLEMIDDLRQTILRELKLEDVAAADITPDLILFGEGLGLDSLDAVELAVVLEKNYGVQFTDTQDVREAFATLNSLAAAVLRLQVGATKA